MSNDKNRGANCNGETSSLGGSAGWEADNIYYVHQTHARRVMKPEDAKRLANEMREFWMRILGDKLPSDKSAKIYEAGCGPGAFLLFLKMLGYANVEGSDFSENQVQIARGNGVNVRLAESVSEVESFAEESLDCVVAIDFIEHLEKGKAVRFMRACGRALKKGGILILRMPNGDSPFVGRNIYNDITHQWAYTTVSMRALLEIAGFSEVEFRDESEAALKGLRIVKVPLMRLCQWIIKIVVRAATREQIQHLSPSIFVFGKK